MLLNLHHSASFFWNSVLWTCAMMDRLHTYLMQGIGFWNSYWLAFTIREHPTTVLLPGKSHGWRSLVGCSPWDHEESDMTERLHFHFSLSRIGEGNGNPLQCSCLENPRDGGALWATVYGVTQSRTRLKRLSSSSSSSFYNALLAFFLTLACSVTYLLGLP